MVQKKYKKPVDPMRSVSQVCGLKEIFGNRLADNFIKLLKHNKIIEIGLK
jgi:hypothetical protein